MANMSYCRFQNTRPDFQECAEVLEAMIEGDGKPLSPEELAAARLLAKRAVQLTRFLAGFLNLDEEVLIELEKQVATTVTQLNDALQGGDDEEDD